MFSLSSKMLMTGAALGMLLGMAEAQAVTLDYAVTDLTDTAVGEDLWQYTYTLTGTLAPATSFLLKFDPSLYGDLQDPAPAVDGWLLQVTQPDAGLGAEGLLTATVDSPGPSVSPATFLLNVVWLGTGAPGAQLFEVQNDTFNVIDSGTTTVAAVVPVPAAGWLMGAGLLSLGRMVRRRAA